MRVIALLLSVLVLTPIVGADYQTGDEDWREIEVNMSGWTDGPDQRVHLWMNQDLVTL